MIPAWILMIGLCVTGLSVREPSDWRLPFPSFLIYFGVGRQSISDNQLDWMCKKKAWVVTRHELFGMIRKP